MFQSSLEMDMNVCIRCVFRFVHKTCSDMIYQQEIHNLDLPYPSQTGIPMLSIKLTISDGQAAPATNLWRREEQTNELGYDIHITHQHTFNTHPARRLPPKRFLIFDSTISSSILCLSPSTSPRGGATTLSLLSSSSTTLLPF